MNVSAVSQGTSGYTGVKNNELDRNAFLRILVAQLKNQDPMSPLEDKDFIAQIAQFSVLEEIKNLGTGIEKMNAMNYIGKYVTAMYQDLPIEGRVEAVSLSEHDVILHIGEYDIHGSDVTGVINL